MPRIIDIIDHTNVRNDELAYREPQQGSGDWRMGSQVIVGESQAAVFVRSGEALDVLGTGRHTLSTANLPILSGLIGLATSGRTPFTADLYFVNLKDMPPVGWGTKSTQPKTYEFTLPLRADYDGQQAFTDKYKGRCVEPGAHDVDSGSMWYYYRPAKSGCNVDAASTLTVWNM